MIPAQGGSAEPAQVRAAIDEILAGSEFQQGTSWLDRALHAIGEWLSELFPGLASNGGLFVEAARILVWIVLIAVAVFLGWIVARALLHLRPAAASVSGPSADREDDRALRVARLRREARGALSRGEHVLALRLEFTALVVGLGERGDLEYRDAYTNRELLERGKPGAEAERVLRPIVPELDRKSFGGEPADAGDFARLSALCDRLLAGSRA